MVVASGKQAIEQGKPVQALCLLETVQFPKRREALARRQQQDAKITQARGQARAVTAHRPRSIYRSGAAMLCILHACDACRLRTKPCERPNAKNLSTGEGACCDLAQLVRAPAYERARHQRTSTSCRDRCQCRRCPLTRVLLLPCWLSRVRERWRFTPGTHASCGAGGCCRGSGASGAAAASHKVRARAGVQAKEARHVIDAPSITEPAAPAAQARLIIKSRHP